MDLLHHTLIESIGVHLPPQSVSTDEMLAGCQTKIQFPLEKITGIKTRREGGQGEYSIDLARKAIEKCFFHSRYNPGDIDLLVCCNISRVDDLHNMSFEPCTSLKLKHQFAFTHALAFDITNACAGMFTGISIVNDLLKTGVIRRGMVVSGEYITHLARTAQKTIESFMDTRLACLTLGDAGAALILENGPDPHSGFQKIEMRTYGRYSPYCIAKTAGKDGMIMYTDSVNLTDVSLTSGAKIALEVIDQAGWPPDGFQHLIMHQTSTMTLNSARNEINRLLQNKVCHHGNTINNLEQRGNTASTSHFVAISDYISNGKIQSGDRIVFSINASGLTVGTALYIFDDLPDRIRQLENAGTEIQKVNSTRQEHPVIIPDTVRIRIESVGTMPAKRNGKSNSMDLLKHAAQHCFSHSKYESHDIGLLIFSGVYRSEYLLEPAYATLLAGELDMNATFPGPEGKKTFAFDVFNGALGFLNACYMAQQMIASGHYQTAMITASEIENNSGSSPDEFLGVGETASALILDAKPANGEGFSRFQFSYYTEWLGARTLYYSTGDTHPYLHIAQDPDIEALYIRCILQSVQAFLQSEKLDLNQIDVIFPPQISSTFITRLSDALAVPHQKCIDAVGEGPDLFSSSLPYALEHAYTEKRVSPGDTGLIIAVGSGIQVGCALYHF